MSTLNANVYNRHWTNVVIHYLPFKVLTGDVLFSVVIFMCLSVVKLYIDYSVWWRWLHCHQDGSTENMQTSPASRREKHIRYCWKWNSLSQSKTHNELIFPSLPFYSVRGDIDIHTSQRALCQFPSLIQICSERSTNPLSSAGCEDDSPSCLKRKLQEQHTRGSFLILRDVNAQDISEQFHPNEVFSSLFYCVCSMYRLNRWMQLDIRAGT